MKTAAALRNRTIAISWFVVCLVVGTAVLATVVKRQPEWSETLLPVYLAVWVILFFCGRSILSRMYSPKITSGDFKATVSDPLYVGHPDISPTNIFDISKRQRVFPIKSADDALSSILPISYNWNPTTVSPPPGIRTYGEARHQSQFAVPDMHHSHGEWTVFAVLAAEKLLQGIITPTPQGDRVRIEQNQLLLEQLLRQLVGSTKSAQPSSRR